jgi:hypothetical protein
MTIPASGVHLEDFHTWPEAVAYAEYFGQGTRWKFAIRKSQIHGRWEVWCF